MGDQVRDRLGDGSGSHHLGVAEQERLDVLLAEMVGLAGRCGAVVDLVLEKLRYGKGPVRSASFYTEAVPHEGGDNTDGA